MSAIDITRLDPAAYRRTPWKNGAGMTIDVADAYRPGFAAGGWDGMLWRFGRTRIEHPGPFSDLSGFERIIAVIEGSGLILHARGHADLDVRAPLKPARFAGEWSIVSELTAGPVGVVNLIADRSAFDIDMDFVAAHGSMAVGAGRAIVLALAPSRLSIGGQELVLECDAALSLQAAVGWRLSLAGGLLVVAQIRAKRQAIR